LKFQTEYKKIRKLKINKENLIDDNNEDKVKKEKPWKSFEIENVSDNFYLNIMDLYNYKLVVGSREGVKIYDSNNDNKEIYNYDSQNEIYCVKFL
jgi:hypothetical protein